MRKTHLPRAVSFLEPLEARLLFAAGGLDTSFSFNGKTSVDVLKADDSVADVAVQTNGRIIIAGDSINSNGNDDLVLVRLMADGSLDRDFGAGGGDGDGRVSFNYNNFDEDVTCVAIQNDGKILVGGRLGTTLNQTRAFVARFNKDGSKDFFFGSNGVALLGFGVQSAIINDLAIQQDGNIVAVATVTLDSNQDQRIGVARLTRFGETDFTFVGGGSTYYDAGSASDAGNAVAIQPDGKILLAGAGDGVFPADASTDMAVLRLNGDGSPDQEFGDAGKVLVNFRDERDDEDDAGDSALDIALMPNGQIVLAGRSSNGGPTVGAVALLDPDGNVAGQRIVNVRYSDFRSVAVQADNRIVAIGNEGKAGELLAARFTPDLDSLDSSFGTGGRILVNLSATSSDRKHFGVLQPDGRIVAAGETRIAQDDTDFGIFRFLAYEDSAASISGRIFKDRDGDGVRDDNDAGHSAVRVYIDENKNGRFNANTEPSALTDANGKYTIPGLSAGSHRIRQLVPRGFRQSSPGKSYYSTTLEAGQEKGGRDFGNTVKALLSGRVFRDDDGDGMLADNEQGMKNFRVYIDVNNNGQLDDDETSVLSDETGRWSFVLDAADNVIVRVIRRDGFERTTPGRLRVDLAKGEVSSGHVFGLRRIN